MLALLSQHHYIVILQNSKHQNNLGEFTANCSIYFHLKGKITKMMAKGGSFMAQALCTICGNTCSEGISRSCPECGNCVCDDCGDLFEGYCQSCIDSIANKFEEI